MIVSGFHTRNDAWILPHKLRVLSRICDAFVVILDRCPELEPLVKSYPKASVIHWTPTHEIPDREDGGNIQCEEGWMRQAAWDWCAAQKPDYILLGDSDEVPTPDIVGFLGSNPAPAIDCFYTDIVNLYGSAYNCITGPCVYSHQRQDNNKRGAIHRVRAGVTYQYRKAFAHVRLEPNCVCESKAVEDATHKRINSPKWVHYKWANWPRWDSSPQRNSAKYQNYLKDVEISPTPRPWLWRWDADEMLSSLPEPIAVVGNGPIEGRGREIDGHPSVIRFNNFEIAGYEDSVGTRTDVWCTNCWHDLRPREWAGEMCCVMHEGHHDEEVGRWLGMYPHMRIPGSNWIVSASQALGVRRPSTGLTLLHHLAATGKCVDAYGFSGMKKGHYWNPAHTHGHEDERKALAKLAEMGVNLGTETDIPNC